MGTKRGFAIFLVLLFSGGCRQYEVGGEVAYSLDDALSMARDRCRGNIYDCYSYLPDLEKLRNQAEGNEKEVVEREMLTFLLKRLEDYGDTVGIHASDALERLGQRATSDDIKRAAAEALLKYEQVQEAETEQEREEKLAQEEKRAEEVRLAFRESRESLLRIAAGRLNDKPAEEVRKLLGDWARGAGGRTRYWFLEDFLSNLSDDELGEYFGADVFYRTFGQPQRKQYIDSDGAYYFYYECRDGVVQIRVLAALLSGKKVVFVSDLNIL